MLGLRVVVVSGALLAADLLFLPWHHFELNLGELGVGVGQTLRIDLNALEPPNSPLGIFALALALGLVAYALLDPLVRGRLAPHQRLAWDRFSQITAPATLVVLILKLILKADFLGVGAWLAVVLAAPLALAGFVAGREGLLSAPAPPSSSAAPGAPVSPSPPTPVGTSGAEGTGRPEPDEPLPVRSRLSDQQRRWLLLGVLIVGTTLAIPWLTSGTDETSSQRAPTTTSGPTGSGRRFAEATTLPPRGQTSVDRPSVEASGSVTVGATGTVPDAAYELRLAREADACPVGTPLGAARNANASGEIEATPTVLPAGVPAGRYFLCFVQSRDPSSHTRPVEVLVS